MKYTYYHKLSREMEGPCNICGRICKLTWDHVPPKNSFNRYPIKYNPLLEITKQDEVIKQSTSQKGIRFRTICDSCNNDLLGKHYDPVMHEMSEFVKRYMTTEIEIPSDLTIEIRINRLCRAVCGHLLAALVTYDDVNLIDKSLREYVLDPNRLPPKGMQLLAWPYPYGSIVISRNFVVKARSELVHFPDGVVSFISSFPVSYVLHDGTDNCGLVDLFSYCTPNIDDVVSVPIDFNSMMYPNTSFYRNLKWPCDLSETPYAAMFVLGSRIYLDGSVFAIQSKDSVNRIIM